MTSIFISIYHFFRHHRILFYLSLAACTLVMAYFAIQVRFEENVTRFLPDTQDAQTASRVFENLKVKDKIIVMLSATDSTQYPEQEQFIKTIQTLEQKLQVNPGQSHIKEIFYQVNENLIEETSDFVYRHLPLFLTEADYQQFDSLLTHKGIEQAMRRNYFNLISPAGMALKSFILKDPLGLGNHTLTHLQDFQLEANYELIDGYIFLKDEPTACMFITPVFTTGSTGENEKLITALEKAISELNQPGSTIHIEYFGGPSVGVYNARQIKTDTLLTSIVALLIIVLFISLVFKRKSAIPLIIIPTLFGGLFALCIIYFIKGSMSAIAIGAGSVVFGIALSYSIHILAHQNHVTTVEQLIKEIAYPLTVGSFTTIGAFTGLLFTSSDLLRDFGLFASLALIGTTLFCLIYLPHFLKGQAHIQQGRVLSFIERMNAYPFEKNKWLVGVLAVITVVCLFTSQLVKFDENMMNLNYEPTHLKQAEEKLNNAFNKTEKSVLFISTGKNMEEATNQYIATNHRLKQLKQQGDIIDFANAQQFLIPQKEQQKRLERWNHYWTAEKKALLQQDIKEYAGKYQFKEDSFEPFFHWLDHPFEPLSYRTEGNETGRKLLSEWQTSTDSLTMLITQVRLKEKAKETIYQSFSNDTQVVVFDRSYFTNKWVSAINDDFYLILYLSSFIVFFALLLSYGRIELTLMSFLPMLISWIIIVGIMGLLGIEFNIVSIILSTFIFGIGDDFSIFIMDGLQSKYKTGKSVLNSHKTAIFFSAFTMIVGMGALIFAKHPALQSISIISILGMIAVVLVAYTIQPIFFHLFIARPASKGLPPYTLAGIVRSGIFFFLFGLGCLFITAMILLLYLIPIAKAKKQAFICRLICYNCRFILKVSTFVRKEKRNEVNETFWRPGIIVANHQSYIDILVLLSLSPKIVMVTKKWVWNSPVFGTIIRYVDFFYAGEGYELSVDCLHRKVQQGYSIAIFPEGTRSETGQIKRFHKGAFYLAKALQLDIIPVLFYGHNHIASRKQPFNLRKGLMVTQVLPRITREDTDYGTTYQEQTKGISAYMKKEYARLYAEKNNPEDPFFYETLVHNYIYKGPVEEWYIRIKVMMEKNYRLFHKLLPQEGQITDIGCGLGPLCYMLSLLSDKRELLGIDYDEDKIALAQNAWLQNERTTFICADALTANLPESDAFILSDMLHYMSYEHQEALLKKCISLLRPNGVIIVRDGNTSDKEKHRITRFTELLSTRVVRFNKTREQLCFTSESQIRKIANKYSMTLETIKNDNFTSNTIYLFRKTV